MILESLTFELNSQSQPICYQFDKGCIGLELRNPAQILQLTSEVVNALMAQNAKAENGLRLQERFDELNVRLRLGDDQNLVLIDLLKIQQLPVEKMFAELFFQPDSTDGHIVLLEQRQICDLLLVTTMPYTYNFSNLFSLLHDIYRQNRPAINEKTAKLRHTIIRERDNCRMLVQHLFLLNHRLQESERELQRQTALRDQFQKFAAQKSRVEAEIATSEKAMREGRSKLRKIARQEKQCSQLHALQEKSGAFHAERDKIAAAKIKIGKLKRLQKQVEYFASEIAKDEQIIARLHGEIAALGDLKMLELDITDRQDSYRSFIEEATAWLSDAEKTLADLRAKGEKISKLLSQPEKSEMTAGSRQNLEVELDEIRRLYSAKKSEIEQTEASISQTQRQNKQVEKLQWELADKKQNLEKINKQIEKVDARIRLLHDEMAPVQNEIKKLGTVEYDPKLYAEVCSEVEKTDKMLTTILKMEQESQQRGHFAKALDRSSSIRDQLETDLEKVSAALRDLDYNAASYAEQVEEFSQTSKEHAALVAKLASTRSALHLAENEFCNSSAHISANQRQGWEAQRQRIVQEAQRFINSMWHRASGGGKADFQLQATDCEQAKWWEKQPVPRQRLLQLGLSFATRSWLRSLGAPAPELLCLDDSLALENLPGKFRHEPVLQQLSETCQQIFFIAQSIPQEASVSQKIKIA